jgi:hypothetical protein
MERGGFKMQEKVGFFYGWWMTLLQEKTASYIINKER